MKSIEIDETSLYYKKYPEISYQKKNLKTLYANKWDYSISFIELHRKRILHIDFILIVQILFHFGWKNTFLNNTLLHIV